MAWMNLPTKQKQTHKPREQACGCQVEGVWGEMDGSLGLSDAN